MKKVIKVCIVCFVIVFALYIFSGKDMNQVKEWFNQVFDFVGNTVENADQKLQENNIDTNKWSNSANDIKNKFSNK